MVGDTGEDARRGDRMGKKRVPVAIDKSRNSHTKEKVKQLKRKNGYNKKKGRGQRKALKQYSFKWTLQSLAHYVTFGMIKPPKTERTDYKRIFRNNNPGILIPGLYFCIYCGMPICSWKITNKRLEENAALAAKGKKRKRDYKMYVDHIKPVNWGGVNASWNLAPACSRCNQKKKDKQGVWLVRGIIGKVVYSSFQILSNIVWLPGRLVMAGLRAMISK